MLILASKSPRRVQMLRGLGLELEVMSADVDESHEPDPDPVWLVSLLSERKARAIRRGEEDIVLSADTVVSLDGKILEKPSGREQAASMLRMLSGRGHKVYTGYTIIHKDGIIKGVGSASVYFKELSEEDIEWYLSTGESFDKAGGYGIQGYGCMLVDKIEGDYNSVVGLPLGEVGRHLMALGCFDRGANGRG